MLETLKKLFMNKKEKEIKNGGRAQSRAKHEDNKFRLPSVQAKFAARGREGNGTESGRTPPCPSAGSNNQNSNPNCTGIGAAAAAAAIARLWKLVPLDVFTRSRPCHRREGEGRRESSLRRRQLPQGRYSQGLSSLFLSLRLSFRFFPLMSVSVTEISQLFA